MGKLAGSGGHNSIVQGANSIYGKNMLKIDFFLMQLQNMYKQQDGAM